MASTYEEAWKTCPTCKGTGKATYQIGGGRAGMCETCRNCGGLGEVRR